MKHLIFLALFFVSSYSHATGSLSCQPASIQPWPLNMYATVTNFPPHANTRFSIFVKSNYYGYQFEDEVVVESHERTASGSWLFRGENLILEVQTSGKALLEFKGELQDLLCKQVTRN